MQDVVTKFLREAGYSDEQIRAGLEYADGIGYRDRAELAMLAIARILYSDSQIEDGETVGRETADFTDL